MCEATELEAGTTSPPKTLAAAFKVFLRNLSLIGAPTRETAFPIAYT